jgi:transposase
MISKKSDISRKNIQMIDIDSLVPKNHLVRLVDKVIDFDFIREIVKDYYSDNLGRPSIDPVVLFKIVFIQFLFGIKSMRQTIKEINVNVAYRWFLGYGFTEPIPHFSTFGKNYIRRFKDTDVFEQIFKKILAMLIENGFIKEETYFIDSTHIKAYANKRNVHNEFIEEDYNKYIKTYHNELNEVRIKENKKPIDFNTSKKNAISNIDPECGMFHKGEKERQLAYSVQTAVDENGYVVRCKTTAGNINDNNGGVEFLEELKEEFPETKEVVMDSGYTSPVLLNMLIEKGIRPIVPYSRPKGKKVKTGEWRFRKMDYKYIEMHNYYICPNLKILTYRGMNAQGYLEYKSRTKDCRGCPLKYRCTNQKIKTITRHLLENVKDTVREIRLTDRGKEQYKKRKFTVERTFAQCKMSHNLGFTLVRGLKKNHDRNLIIYSVANIKKLVLFVTKNNIKILKESMLIRPFLNKIGLFFLKKQKNSLVFNN